MKWIKNERGLSLIELLATTVLTLIILVLVFSIVVSSQRQNVEQTKEGQQINDASYVLKIITKDMRKTGEVEFKASNDYVFHLHENSEQVSYQYVNNELRRNGQVLANHVEEFEIKSNDKKSYINIAFSINGQAYNASLSYRKGTTS